MGLSRGQTEIEIKVGLFITFGLGLMMALIVMLGGARSIFSSQNTYTAHFNKAQGLIRGSQIELNGIKVGIVEEVYLDRETRDIKVTMVIEAEFAEWIRKDTIAEISTQGVLGDKYIALVRGTPEYEAIPNGGNIDSTDGSDLSKMLTSGKDLLQTLKPLAKNLEEITAAFKREKRHDRFFEGLAVTAKNMARVSQKLDEQFTKFKLNAAVSNLNKILKKINRGDGTLGALVNDPALYHDAKALVGGGSRNRIIRNLIRKTIRESEERDSKQHNNRVQRKKAGS